jgi:hypothetical protein
MVPGRRPGDRRVRVRERLLHPGNGPAIRDALLGLPNVLIAEVPYRRPYTDRPAAWTPGTDATLGG